MKKRTLTLLEIMIVIVLIGIIGSVIGVNMKGSLDEGRAFKTRQAQQQIHDILTLAIAQGAPVDDVVTNPVDYLSDSGLVKDPKKFIKDGWSNEFDIKVGGKNRDKLIISSSELKKYDAKKKGKNGKSAQQVEEYDDDEAE